MSNTKTNMNAVPYLMKNTIQNYEWGKRGNDAFIPKLLGFPPDDNKPYAELWLGAHVKSPSSLEIDGKSYSFYDLVKEYPAELVGKYSAGKFGNRLPYLLKILSAGEALSIQVHPNKNQAKQLHSKDPLNYPDDNHKPEIAIAIDHLKALAGFKPVDEILEVLKTFPEIENIFTDHFVFKPGDTDSEINFLKDLYTRINQLDESGELIKNILNKIEQRLRTDKNIYPLLSDLFLSLKEKYGYDRGLFSLFILNYIELAPGEALFLDSGLPHAYLEGNIIECMSNSDNVIRAGLTSKYKDVQGLLDTINYAPGNIPVIKPGIKDGEKIYNTPAEEFLVTVMELDKNSVKRRESGGNPEIIFILNGEAVITSDDYKLELKKGDSAFIPAFLPGYKIDVKKKADIIKVSLP